MVAVRDGHELIGKAKVEVALIKVAVPVVIGIVPREVHLAPLAIDARGIPGVAVSLNAPVRDAGGVQKFGIDALVALAGAQATCKAALGRAIVEGVVIFELVKDPVVQPERHVVLGARRLRPALGHGVVDNLGNRGPGRIVYLHDHRGAKVPDAAASIHKVEVDSVGTRSR